MGTIIENEIYHHAFHGMISLHTDDTTLGIYGFARGATLTQHLLKPALRAAEMGWRPFDESMQNRTVNSAIVPSPAGQLLSPGATNG